MGAVTPLAEGGGRLQVVVTRGGAGNTHITLMGTPTKNIGRGRTPEENPKNLAQAPVRALEITKSGRLRPLTYVNRNGDVRWVAGSFLVSLQKIWEEMGDDVLRRVASSHPELLMMAMCKIAAVQRLRPDPAKSEQQRPHAHYPPSHRTSKKSAKRGSQVRVVPHPRLN
jgi:hypothetical protein